MGKFGFSFSAKRALGVTKLKSRIARASGIPTTKAGRQRKLGAAIDPAGIFGLLGGSKRSAQRRAIADDYDDDNYDDGSWFEPRYVGKEKGFLVGVRQAIGLLLFLPGLLLAALSYFAWIDPDPKTRPSAIILTGLAAICILIGGKLMRRKPVYTYRQHWPATEKQKAFARQLGIRFDQDISKANISALITAKTGK
jgi:hypothetical protein